MNIEFPHLDDTKFPGISDSDNLSGVDVYKYENDFDYYRWKNQVSVKLLNVLWNSNYADVPYFEDDTKRDEWFNKQDGIIQPLLTPFNNTPDTNIQLPIPYNDAYKYNYVVIDMPMQTDINNPIDYESENTRVKRWYYFVQDINQLAPNTTQFIITLDYWTTFIHSVSINYLMLERGHAPMTKTSVEQYLANPIENNQYLLADDFNYQRGESVIKASNFTPIGNGKKYVIFAAPYSQSDFDLFGGTDYSGESTPPTYANTDERWGYQLDVNNYAWKYGETDYTNAHLPIRGALAQDNAIYNGTYCYAIEASRAGNFFNRMAHTRVHFLHGIQAVFILAENMFNRGDGFTFEGETLYRCTKVISEMQYNFTKSAFGFDAKYAELTKLYTNPYSFVEVTDDNGNSFNFNIENTGNLKMHSEVSLAFPFLRYNVFFAGINGTGEFNYTWKNLNDNNVSKTMWESDFSKFMMNWDIPTYSIYISSEYEYAANNAAGMRAKRLGAIKDYKNATRFANTNRENVADSMATNTANVRATGTAQSANTGTQNTANTNITNRANTALRNNTDTAMEQNLAIKNANNDKINGDYHTDNDATAVLTTIQNDVLALSTAVNQAASIVSGVTGSIASANPLGIVNVGIDAAAVGATTSIAMSNNSAVSTITQTANRDKGERAMATNTSISMYVRKSMNDQANENIDMRGDNTTTQNNASQTITDNTVATNNANAARTQTTETNNATYTRNANVVANKANLVQAQIEAEAQYKNARLQRPITQGEYAGDAYPDIWMRRGIRFNIRTQTKAAIAQTGDAFLRFGYALHQIWDMSSGFNYMKHFTFWKAEDIWVNDGSGVANIAVNIISDILLKGVTVWANPEEIGKVSIYDNI